MMDGPLVLKKELDHGYVCCRGALGPLLNIKGHSVAFIQRFKAACIDAGVMYKYIRPVFLLDKTVAFFAVKPFHISIRHRDTLLVKKILKVPNHGFSDRKLGIPSGRNRPANKERSLTDGLNINILQIKVKYV